jgi:ATP-binding cassette, subfamily B, multidrug efflux pump
MRGGPPGSIQAIAQISEEKAQNRAVAGRRLLAEFNPYRSSLALVLTLVLILAVTQAFAPWLVGRAIDENIANRDARGLAIRMLELLGVYVVGTVVGRAQTFLIGSIGQKLLAGLRARLFDQLQHLPLSFFDKRPIGDLMSRVQSDVDTLSQLLGQGLTQVLGSLFGLVGILVAMLVLNVPLALASFTVIPIMLLTTSFFAARARAAFRKTRETAGDVTADLQEEIVGVREAQAFNRTEANITKFRTRNAANRDANVSAVGITSAFTPAIDVLATLANALVIGYGGWLSINAGMSVGLIASFLLYVQQFFRPIQLASQVYTQLQSALAGAERIYAILDESREPIDPVGVTRLEQSKGRIEFEHVVFAYDQSQAEANIGAARNVLEDVSFMVEPGQTVAIVGSTGAGKTTIASLIPRFYDVTSGRVKIDGTDVCDLSRESLRSSIAMVLQEAFLFSGTVAENIRYGRLEATQAEVEAAAKVVNAHEFIAALPKGYETVLQEGGNNLSQGQRQLLSFARAVIRDPRILILDEATANVDTRTEAIIQKALETLLAGRTSVVIAHRLSTVRNADLILVIEAGRIVERGTHEELLEVKGRYFELYQQQFRSQPATLEVVSK